MHMYLQNLNVHRGLSCSRNHRSQVRDPYDKFVCFYFISDIEYVCMHLYAIEYTFIYFSKTSFKISPIS